MLEETVVNSGISVIMPTYNQGSFIARSIKSLLLQSFNQWELILIDDGCTDYTEEVVKEFLFDSRINYLKNDFNTGLGYSLNKGIEQAQYDLVAYLPSDDIYYRDHLQVLYETITSDEGCVLAYSGMLHNYTNSNFSHFSEGTLSTVFGYYELVQVLHKKTDAEWLERKTLVTDDLNFMYWDKLLEKGKFLPTQKVTCEWVSHPEQRHKLIKETSSGGIFPYKLFYKVSEPIRFHSSVGNYIDEITLYERFRHRKKEEEGTKPSKTLKILIVGELAYNAERICALEEYGHKLYGLWIMNPEFYNTIGPLPFGNVENISLDNWKEKVEEIKPDIIYALLNFQVIPLAHYILTSNPGIPFVWHFKEAPFYARQHGLWKQLLELYTNSDGQIFINQETKEWFFQFLLLETPTFILDGDLPKKEWFAEDITNLLSDEDGEIHTVIPGRPFGINPIELASFKTQKIHLHFYGEFFHTTSSNWIEVAKEAAGDYIHVHPNCSADQWGKEFSKYDAGWLHIFDSNNNGELMKVTWNDLNYPARMSTLATAGLPMILKSNLGHTVAVENLVKTLDIGIFFKNFIDLKKSFDDEERRKEIRENAWKHRFVFSFDFYVKDLTEFFYQVIESYTKKNH